MTGERPPTVQYPGHDCLWLDRPLLQIEEYVEGLGLSGAESDLLRQQLVNWQQFGFVILKGAIPNALIDALLRDIEQLFEQHDQHRVIVESDGFGPRYQPVREYPADELNRLLDGVGHLRIVDFYSYSIAAKKISLHDSITGFLRHVFRDDPVLLQSLTFMRGTEQELHQDFPYVPAHVRSHLAATWVALEDVTTDTGPLQYVPGSHYNKRFEWGDGLVKTPRSTKDHRDFQAHLLEQAKVAGVPVFEFCPGKGDVLVWHGALAHGGKRVLQPGATRKSYVSHYSDASTHHWDYRDPSAKVERRRLGGGFYHVNPIDPDSEDVFTNGSDC